MILFPNCKINLGLNIVRKRSDGYHDLETVFYPLPLRDALEVVRNDGDKVNTISLSGISQDELNPLEILPNKAIKLIHDRLGYSIEGIQLHLHKAIPIGAGLGGGSADGAFALTLFNEKFKLGLSTEQLLDYALQLGSDCPFFIINKPCFATGRGELLQRMPLDLSGYTFVLVHPGIHSSTANAFTHITPAIPAKSIKEIIKQPIETWKDELINDFEAPVSKQYPVIKEIKEKLYETGALYACMTGSGSSLYGIFPKGKAPAKDFVPYNYHILDN